MHSHIIPHSINPQLISHLIDFFSDEMNMMVDKIDTKFILEEKKELLKSFDNMPIVFTGYGRIEPLKLAVDDTEFHLNILSFFNRNGKILFEDKFMDENYSQTIVFSFYNIDTNDIAIVKTSSQNNLEENAFVHLQWLDFFKENIFSILHQLIELNQTSSKIKIHSHKFKELIQNDKNSSTTESDDNL